MKHIFTCSFFLYMLAAKLRNCMNSGEVAVPCRASKRLVKISQRRDCRLFREENNGGIAENKLFTAYWRIKRARERVLFVFLSERWGAMFPLIHGKWCVFRTYIDCTVLFFYLPLLSLPYLRITSFPCWSVLTTAPCDPTLPDVLLYSGDHYCHYSKGQHH